MADYGTKLTGFSFSNFVGENLSAYDWNTVVGADANCLAMMVAQRDRVTQASDRVSAWDDRSDNDKDATQATSGNQPLIVDNVFGTLPALRFDRSRLDRLVSAVSLPVGSDLSFVVVVKAGLVANPARYIFSGGGSAGVVQLEVTSDGRFGFTYGSGAGYSARALTLDNVADGTTKALLCTYDRTTKKVSISVNGGAAVDAISTNQPPDLAATTLIIGARYDQTTGYTGDLLALVPYDVDLRKSANAAKMATARSFILNKFGLPF